MKSLQWAAILISLSLLAQCHPKKTETKAKGIVAAKDTVTYITFEKTATVNDSSDIGVDWKTEKPTSEFTLNGKKPLAYKFELLNDSTAVLSQKVNRNWLEQDRFEFQPWHWIITEEGIVSQFEIKDFNNDGNDDLVCLISSNVNANEWVYIYLNNGSKLIKLYNTADEDYIWDNPQYNPKTKTINTELFSSAYGIANTATYKLDDLIAKPLEKNESDSATKSDAIINKTYIGKNGKWKLVKTETEEITEQE